MGSELIGSLRHSSGSYELVFGAVIAGLVGLGIDLLSGTTPIFTIVFSVLGLAGAATSIIYSYRIRMTSAEADRQRRRDGHGAS